MKINLEIDPKVHDIIVNILVEAGLVPDQLNIYIIGIVGRHKACPYTFSINPIFRLQIPIYLITSTKKRIP